jgi:hypothetical protein
VLGSVEVGTEIPTAGIMVGDSNFWRAHVLIRSCGLRLGG